MKINRNALSHSGVIGIFFLYFIYVLIRFVPSFHYALSHAVYLCQSFLQNIPALILTTISISFIYASIRMIINKYNLYTFKKKLQPIKNAPHTIKRIENSYGLHNKIVITSNNKPLAFCMGIVNPKIYISQGLINLMTENELKAVILHEKYHLENNDNLFLNILYFFKHLLFIFPFISDIVHNFEMKEEIQADLYATKQTNIKDFITAMKKMIVNSNMESFGFSFAKEHFVEARILHILGRSYKPKIHMTYILMSLLSLVALTFLLILPISTTEVHAQDKDIVMMCIGTQRCEPRCEQNTLFTPRLPS